MTSVASSPIFFRMASSPLLNSFATYELSGDASLRASMVAVSFCKISLFIFILNAQLTACQQLFFVYFVRRFYNQICFLPFPLFQTRKETALPPGVTGNAALLFDLQQNHVRIAIQPDFFNLLDMPGLFALMPELFA